MKRGTKHSYVIVHIPNKPHALRRLMRKKVFETTMDDAFSKVIEQCAKREDT